MFATIANGYPRGPLPAQPDRLGDADRRFLAGELPAADHAAIVEAFVAEVVHEQARAGLAFLGDGGVRDPDRLLPLTRGLGGLEPGPTATLPTGEIVTAPRVSGPIAWAAPITVAGWTFAAGLTDLPVKQALIGPYTIGRLAAIDAAERPSVTLAIAEALNAELHALAAAGVPVVQVDEDGATAIGDDRAEWELLAAAHRALTAGVETDIVHLSFSALGGAVDRAGFAAVLDRPYRSVLFDALAGPAAWRFALSVPPDRGLIAGAVDAHRPTYDEIEVMVAAMAWAARDGRGEERVGIAPNATLALIDRHYARRKCERMGEAVRIARMGPLQEVADALEPDPAHSQWPELRELAAAVETARSDALAGAVRNGGSVPQLGYADPAGVAGPIPAPAGDAVESIELEIRNPSGLHARPAAVFVRAAAASRSRIRVVNLARDGAEADAKSILGVLGLGVSQGSRIRLSAEGEDAAETIARLAGLIVEGLGETMPETGDDAAASQTAVAAPRPADVPPGVGNG